MIIRGSSQINNPTGKERDTSERFNGLKIHRRSCRPHIRPLPSITFTSVEARYIKQPHNDALVVTMKVTNYNIHRILIDSISSVDVMFKSAYDQMEIPKNKLKTLPTPLYEFAGDKVLPKSSTELSLTTRGFPSQSKVMTNFFVVNILSI